ncbi:efflux RND transporter periplasmic adaptor subunit [Thiobacter aerophilum]|uniref:Efflux RND transporter periplasmic adaptor subunit n=1 Tax=Thiobacter aerophilum TaxID=3121275 RepID=A0ABV0EDZ2_9BURK
MMGAIRFDKRLLLVLSLVAAAVAATRWWQRRPETPAPAPPAQLAHSPNILRFAPDAPQLAYLRIQPVTMVAAPASPPLPARIVYDEDRTARVTTPVAGRVIAILVQVGDRVAAGQPLAWVDAPEYGSAVADAAKARADLQQKRAAYERAKTLFDGQVLAAKDLEAAAADLAQAQAEAQRTALRLANLSQGAHGVTRDGERLSLRAPIAGVVAERQINPGAEIRPDGPGPQFVVTDPSHLWLAIDLPEQLLGKARVGQRVDLEVDAFTGETFHARIASIGVALDPATRRVPVRCVLPNPDGRLKPEMFARASLIADGAPPVVRVPNTALVVTGLDYFVFVETAPGVLQKRRVTIASQDRDYAIVAAGLTAGERIVTSGALLINSELTGG